ncbi:Zinc carboxypeptidase [Shewanella sp. P1-14-1]|uniref:M14 family metallopeptidase n=1 Tax=Shewanella sp. P1-14-1 TaxID=1723761 RepID=UPI0006E5426E|nr:M14 family metallopeptidase [Shewanella sp. P1-14-1]KPZ68443.1 Zinc carboxypeptidase [Shewanella sp. P1-14-1]
MISLPSHLVRLLIAVMASLPLFVSLSASSQTSAADTRINQRLLSEDINADITLPAEYLGYPLGEWHLRHDQINQYLQILATESERVSLDSAGYSQERRHQLTAVITSETNQKNLSDILAYRSKVKFGTMQNSRSNTQPLVVWLAYSIHGDEASGAHAAIALSHYLASANAPWVKDLLEDTVILITPTQNPDGFDRFSNWANNNKGQVVVTDNNHREHNQDWPGGRFNHYLADLNRDWLFLRHPASQGRVAFFHKWQPHYVGDFHEMWHQQSYFFQPGVPDRVNPLTSKANQQLSNELAAFHRQALDQVKQVYFSEQMFDDFFYGKGSTYPDINGAVGILFEQASSRGQAQASPNGVVTLANSIDNQFATSISSLQGAHNLREKLMKYQTDFFSSNAKRTRDGKQTGRLIKAHGGAAHISQLTDILNQHKISFKYLAKPIEDDDIIFSEQDSIFIPKSQPQHDLVEALFDKRTEFKDETFYDISTWNFESALGLTLIEGAKPSIKFLADKPVAKALTLSANTTKTVFPDEAVALIVDWQQAAAAPFLQQLLHQGVLVKYALKPFSLSAANSKNLPVEFVAGSLQIPLKQPVSEEQVRQIVSELAAQYQVNIVAASSSHTAAGMDLGSDDFIKVQPVTPLLVTGSDTNASETGQLWYYLDKTLGIPVTMVNSERLTSIDLSAYSHIFMADGPYHVISDATSRQLGKYVSDGGTIVAQKRALVWLKKRNILKSEPKSKRELNNLFSTSGLKFGDKSKLDARQSIGGAIVSLTLDQTHPITFGLPNPLHVMKNREISFGPTSTPFIVAAEYDNELLVSGFLAKEYQRSFANTPAMIVEKKGKGEVVALTDNLLFRNIWLGTEKVYANALYFVPSAM